MRVICFCVILTLNHCLFFYIVQYCFPVALTLISSAADLGLISNWAQPLLASFSPTKTESILVSSKKDRVSIPDIAFQGEVLKNISSHKHPTGCFLYPLT